MKQLFTLLFVAIATIANAQTMQDTLKEVQVIGINTTKLEPITQTRIVTSDYGYLNQQKDPFFVLQTATPGIYAQSDNGQENGYSYMRLRGLDQTRINYNLNGIPVNEMEDQGLYFSNMPGFYNYLGAITVDRGVGTSKYGTTSLAGSVNMETRNISEKTTEVNVLAKDTYGDQFTNFFYSNGIGKNGLAAQVGGSYINNQGFKEHSGNEGGSIYYALGYVKKNNIIKLYGFSGVAHNQLAFYGVPKNMLDSNYRTNLNATTDKDTFNQNFVCLNWINFANPKAKFNTSVYFDNVNGDYNTAGCLFGVNSRQYGAMTNMVMENDKHQINIGLNTNVYTRKHFGYDNGGYYDYPQNCQYYSNTGHKEDVVAYLKGVKKGAYSNLFYDIQARSVWFNAAPSKTYNWVFLNPKVGIKTTGSKDNLYINAGLTQREPTRTDMLQNIIQSDSAYRYGNPDNTKFFQYDTVKLHPELVTDIEMGNIFHVNNLEINTNLYIMNIHHEYVATGVIDPYSGFMVKQQTNVTMRSGIETNIKVALNHFNVFFNMQAQRSSFALTGVTYTGTIPFCPDYISSIGVSYHYKNLYLGFTELMVSSMHMSLTDNTAVSDPYAVTNLFADYTFKKTLTLSLKFNNIFDQKYYIPAGMAGVPTYYVGQLYNYAIIVKMKI